MVILHGTNPDMKSQQKIPEFVSLSGPSLLGKKKKACDILLMLRGKPSGKRDPNSGIFCHDFMFSSGVI